MSSFRKAGEKLRKEIIRLKYQVLPNLKTNVADAQKDLDELKGVQRRVRQVQKHVSIFEYNRMKREGLVSNGCYTPKYYYLKKQSEPIRISNI